MDTNLRRGECECDGEVEVGISAAGVDPKMVENWRQNATGDVHTRHKKQVPTVCNIKPGIF